MKHQVFFFSLVIATSMYSMDKKIDNQQIVVGLNKYCYDLHRHFPTVIDKKYVDQVNFHMTEILQSSRTEDVKQKKLLKKLEYLPLMQIIGDRAFLLPPLATLDSNNEKFEWPSTNSVY